MLMAIGGAVARRLVSLWRPISRLASAFIISVKVSPSVRLSRRVAADLGTFLILGFDPAQRHGRHRHRRSNTEGATAALGVRGLALLAGGPAVLGMWLGSLAYAPQWSALALAIGAGAILQVIVEVGLTSMRSDGRGMSALYRLRLLAGLAAGVGFMYGTAMLVKI